MFSGSNSALFIPFLSTPTVLSLGSGIMTMDMRLLPEKDVFFSMFGGSFLDTSTSSMRRLPDFTRTHRQFALTETLLVCGGLWALRPLLLPKVAAPSELGEDTGSVGCSKKALPFLRRVHSEIKRRTSLGSPELCHIAKTGDLQRRSGQK